MSHILENLDILSEGFPENKYSIKIKSYIILTFQKLLAPLQCHFWLGNTQYFGFWRIHSIFTPPSLPSHLYLVNILLMCGMTEHIIYSWGNEGPSSVFRIKRITIWGLWWWCDDQKNSCTVRLGFGFNSTVYRIVLQKMRLNWFEQKLMKTSTRSISKLFNEFVQFNQKSFALVLKGRLLIPFDIHTIFSMRYLFFMPTVTVCDAIQDILKKFQFLKLLTLQFQRKLVCTQ